MDIELKEIALDEITLDGRTQPRAIVDNYIVDEYRLDMLAGDTFPPLMVFRENGNYYLADGWHRLQAAHQVGRKTIPCAIKQGTLRDAILYSCGVNADHGKRRTNGDKQRAVNKLLNDPEWSKWNDSEIARICKVSHSLVSKLRPSLNDGKIERKVERNGTVYKMDISKIGKSNGNEKQPAPVLLPIPEYQPKYDPLNYRLFVSPIDAISEHIEPESVDAIITDPPYPKEYLYTYQQMAEQAAIILKPSGILVALAGHLHINTIIEQMGEYLNFHWLGCYYMPSGQHASLAYYSVAVYWKPLVIFSKGAWDKTKTFKDVIINDDADKQYHEWGQGVSGFTRLIESFTKPNDTVLDPFLGGGTTAIAALNSGRYFIGSDISPEEVEKTRGRLA